MEEEIVSFQVAKLGMKDKNEIYNAIGFLSVLLIDLMDELGNTNVYKHRLKQTGNLFLKELESIHLNHFNLYDKEREPIDRRDVYRVVDEKYRYLWKLFRERTPKEIAVLANRIENLKFNPDEEEIYYTPLKK